MPLQDDITRLTAIVTRDLVLSGRAQQYRMAASLTPSELGKASGATPAQVTAWESGKAAPSCQQALAWLSLLLEKASWREAAGKEAAK